MISRESKLEYIVKIKEISDGVANYSYLFICPGAKIDIEVQIISTNGIHIFKDNLRSAKQFAIDAKDNQALKVINDIIRFRKKGRSNNENVSTK